MSFITEDTKGTGVLFNVAQEDRKVDGPIMTGSVEIANQRYYISGFMREAKKEGGKSYLSLHITSPLPQGYTDEDIDQQVSYYGKLFRQDEKHSESSPDYTGFIQVLASQGGEKHDDAEWDNAAQLQVVAHARRNMGDGGARIALSFAPRKVASGELNF